ncbi:MAG: hypothetical protein U0166_20890 [Acidobacteriota bacterium]
MDPRRDIVVALTASGTLYASMPRGNARYKTVRCRTDARRGPREATFDGALLSVRKVAMPVTAPESLVRCGALLLESVPGTYGRPVVNERMAIGGDARGVHEVTSRLTWVGVMDIDRAWVVAPMLRAFRNGARDWRSFLSEQTYERGDEHIQDDTGTLQANALERHYGDYLGAHAAERDEHMQRLGHELVPVTRRFVSNEDVEAGLDSLAASCAGPGMTELTLPASRKHRGSIAASIDRCWGRVRKLDAEAREEIAVAKAA